MRKPLAISIFAVMLIALGAGSADAKSKGNARGFNTAPPHASNTGMTARSAMASRHGANKRGFCPRSGQEARQGWQRV